MQPRLLLPTTLLGLCTLVSSAPAAPQKSLAECIALALALQPTLKSAAAAVEASRERVWQSAANYLPQVTGSASAVRRQTTPGNLTGSSAGGHSQTFNFYSTGVSLSQVLFDFGQTLAQIHAAQNNAASAAADADTQRDTVVFDVAQAYYGLLAAYHLRDVAEDAVAQNQQHLDVAQGRLDVGLAPRFDVTQAQVQLANAELARVTARNNVALGRETLRNTLGLSGPLDFDPLDVLDQPVVTIDDSEALQRAYDNRPELRSLQAREAAAADQIAALEKDYLPKVGSNAGYFWSGARAPLQDGWNIGASVTVPVFNGGLTTAQVGEAKANLRVLQFTETSLRQNITLEVQQATLNIREAVESVRVANKGVEQARENLELAEGRYATGVSSIIELTDAQTSLSRARASRVQAQVNYRIALAALNRATAYQFSRDI